MASGMAMAGKAICSDNEEYSSSDSSDEEMSDEESSENSSDKVISDNEEYSRSDSSDEVISDNEEYSRSDSSDEEMSDEESSDNSSDKTITLYHYTNDEGASGIDNDKMIKASTDEFTDAVFGPGVYLTSKDPYTHSKEEILSNNYDDGLSVYESPNFYDKADSAIEIDLPISEVERVDSERDIYRYEGDLDLNEYPHIVLENI